MIDPKLEKRVAQNGNICELKRSYPYLYFRLQHEAHGLTMQYASRGRVFRSPKALRHGSPMIGLFEWVKNGPFGFHRERP